MFSLLGHGRWADIFKNLCTQDLVWTQLWQCMATMGPVSGNVGDDAIWPGGSMLRFSHTAFLVGESSLHEGWPDICSLSQGPYCLTMNMAADAKKIWPYVWLLLRIILAETRVMPYMATDRKNQLSKIWLTSLGEFRRKHVLALIQHIAFIYSQKSICCQSFEWWALFRRKPISNNSWLTQSSSL